MADLSPPSALIEQLRAALSEYGYTEYECGVLGEFPSVARIMTPRHGTVRYVCAVLEMPPAASNLSDIEVRFELIRGSLSRQYARFPWWKELGTFLIMLCPHGVYESVTDHLSAFKDRTGLHMNVMLGTIAVDVDRYAYLRTSTWGLASTGIHLGAVQECVRRWCQEQTTPATV